MASGDSSVRYAGITPQAPCATNCIPKEPRASRPTPCQPTPCPAKAKIGTIGRPSEAAQTTVRRRPSRSERDPAADDQRGQRGNDGEHEDPSPAQAEDGVDQQVGQRNEQVAEGVALLQQTGEEAAPGRLWRKSRDDNAARSLAAGICASQASPVTAPLPGPELPARKRTAI